ncbi:hypothetical protein BT96DRAFT_980279 [Gymnopus androsaceus JB14]|uniref:Uncharacterized protein n=1 Tax=Gymnopus androsaceus JB14 TaxID=1447944 RepID=A0A6A4GZB6_9AGAR|nr:hypothetical protein BT96DRAFT_980279 [Gymnopus androsaceus JB14]
MIGPEPTPDEVLSFLSDKFPIVHIAEFKNVESNGKRGGLGPTIYLDADLCQGYEASCCNSAPQDCKLNQDDLFFLLVASFLHELSHSLSWQFMNHHDTSRLDEGDSDDPESEQAFEDAVFRWSIAIMWEQKGDMGEILKAAGIEIRSEVEYCSILSTSSHGVYKILSNFSPKIAACGTKFRILSLKILGVTGCALCLRKKIFVQLVTVPGPYEVTVEGFTKQKSQELFLPRIRRQTKMEFDVLFASKLSTHIPAFQDFRHYGT